MAASATPTQNDPKRLVTAAQLGSRNGTLYTAASSERGTRLTALVLVNDTTTSATATIYIVETGGTAGVANIIANAVTIPGDGFPVHIDVRGIIMNASDTIQGLASAASQITYHICGIEMKA